MKSRTRLYANVTLFSLWLRSKSSRCYSFSLFCLSLSLLCSLRVLNPFICYFSTLFLFCLCPNMACMLLLGPPSVYYLLLTLHFCIYALYVTCIHVVVFFLAIFSFCFWNYRAFARALLDCGSIYKYERTEAGQF